LSENNTTPESGNLVPKEKLKENQNNNTKSSPTQNRGNYKGNRYYKNRNYKRTSNYSKNTTPKTSRFRKISVLVPLLNEEESLKPLYSQIKESVTKSRLDYEIIFIDDGSTDGSLKVIKELARQDEKIRYVSFRKNYGKSAALNVGFKYAKGSAVITMDADLQDDPAEIPRLLEELEKFDLVSGWKKKRFDPFVKRHSSKFFNYITRLMSGIKIHDFNCGLKAYRREVVKNIEVHGELHRYIPVLAGWQGFTVSEVVVKHHARRYGKTKFGISRFFKGFVDLITVIFTTRYIKRPMHLFGFLGALAFLAGFIVNGFLSYQWIFQNRSLSNRPLLLLGALLIVVGVQFFSVGLLGEMIVHNENEQTEGKIKERKL